MLTTIGFHLKCIRCGESLAGLSLSERCAKCGLTSADSLNTGVLEPGTAEVNADVACVGCGYNLRTLSLSGVCPECAMPVYRSLRPDDLRFADTSWLKNLRLGMALAAVTFALDPIQQLLPMLIARLWSPASLAWYYQSNAHLAVHLGSMLFWCVGLLLVTTLEPGRALEHRGHRLRSWIRFMALLAPVACLASIGSGLIMNWLSTGGVSLLANAWPRVLLAVRCFLIAPVAICFQAGALLLGLFLGKLAVRDRRRKVPYVSLAVASLLYGAAALACLPIYYLLTIRIGTNSGSGSLSFWLTLHQVSSGVLLLLGFTFGLIGLLASFQFRRMIARAMKHRP